MLTRVKFAALLLILLIASGAQAQEQTEAATQIVAPAPIHLTYGSAASGTIATAGSSESFSFSGAAGDLVFIRILPITSGLQLSATLTAPDGNAIASAPEGGLTARLNTAGGYFLKVSGQNDQSGDFEVRLDAQVGASTSLTIGQVTQADFEVDAPPELFHFQANPNAPTHLTVSADDPTFRFSVTVRDVSGKLIAYFNPETRSAVLTVSEGNDAYNLTLTAADPSLKGLILIDLESDLPAPTEAVTAASTEATQVVPTPGVPIVVTATAGVAGKIYCHISSNATANIRRAPNTNAPALDRLNNNRVVGVIGISADGAWYAVQLAAEMGWVSKQVARETDPCPTLPIIQPQG